MRGWKRTKMEATIILLACTLTCIAAQYNPYQMWGMGNHMWGPGNQISSDGFRYPMYPWITNSVMWRYPGVRTTSTISQKNPLTQSQQSVINLPKVPGSEEVLSHVLLYNQNVKPYVDTISDVMYGQGPHRARQIISPIYMSGENAVRNGHYSLDDCGPEELARFTRDMAEWVY